MCELKEEILKLESFTGYKVAVKMNDKYYSPAMGCVYRIGKIRPIKQQRRIGNYFKARLFLSNFKPLLVGRTAVINNYDNAYWMRESIQDTTNEKVVILKMTIADELLEGRYEGMLVIAGKRILNMEEYTE